MTGLVPSGLFVNRAIDFAKRELLMETDYLRESDCQMRFKYDLSYHLSIHASIYLFYSIQFYQIISYQLIFRNLYRIYILLYIYILPINTIIRGLVSDDPAFYVPEVIPHLSAKKVKLLPPFSLRYSIIPHSSSLRSTIYVFVFYISFP